MTSTNFTIEKSRLRAIFEAGEASNAASKAAGEKLKDAQHAAREALSDLDNMKARKAARNRYLDESVEALERAKFEAAVAASQAIYQEKLDEAQAKQAAYAARQAIAAEAMRLARSCKDYAARFGMKI